jgi:hypothetical protein
MHELRSAYVKSFIRVIFKSNFLKDNYTPLHVAVENCKYLVVQMLLGYGADVQIRGGKV